MDIVRKLSEFAFFSNIPAKELQRFAVNLKTNHFKLGDAILAQGGKGKEVHLLLEGSVEITTKSRDGLSAHIMCHRAPSVFGIIEIWKELPHLGDAIALEPCLTLSLSRSEFLKFLHTNHQACVNLMQALSEEIFEGGIDFRIRIFGSSTHLLARYLWNQVHSFGEKFESGTLLKKQTNKTLLAKSLGISRRQVIREFAELEKQGLLEIQGDFLFIPDPKKLKELFDKVWFERRKNHRD